MQLIFENRVKISFANTRVYGHGGHFNQVRNEVYDWLSDHAKSAPGKGPGWVCRAYRHENTPAGSGYYFYFRERSIAALFKLAWGGE